MDYDSGSSPIHRQLTRGPHAKKKSSSMKSSSLQSSKNNNKSKGEHNNVLSKCGKVYDMHVLNKERLTLGYSRKALSPYVSYLLCM